MKAKDPLRKLTLLKTTIAHLDDEQMTAARGGSCGVTWETVEMCAQSNSAYPLTQLTCQ
jgi:natural product precursor